MSRISHGPVRHAPERRSRHPEQSACIRRQLYRRQARPQRRDVADAPRPHRPVFVALATGEHVVSEPASHLQPVRGGHDLSPVKRSLPQPFGGVLRLGGRKPGKSRGQTWAISTRLAAVGLRTRTAGFGLAARCRALWMSVSSSEVGSPACQ
jgi:hypothetical protein